MRKLIGAAVGLAVFALQDGARAQVQDTREPQAAGAPSSTGSAAGSPGDMSADTRASSKVAGMLSAEVDRLRLRVTQLERQNAELQARLGQAPGGAGGAGVGGSGAAGAGTGGSGAGGTETGGMGPARTGASADGTWEATGPVSGGIGRDTPAVVGTGTGTGTGGAGAADTVPGTPTTGGGAGAADTVPGTPTTGGGAGATDTVPGTPTTGRVAGTADTVPGTPTTGGAGTAGGATGDTGPSVNAGAWGNAPPAAGAPDADATGGAGRAGSADQGQAVVTSTIVGKIQTVSQRRVSILDSEGLRHDFTLSQKTQLVRDGRSMPLEQLREGTEVRATYDLANDPNHATRIEVIGKKAKAARR